MILITAGDGFYYMLGMAGELNTMKLIDGRIMELKECDFNHRQGFEVIEV